MGKRPSISELEAILQREDEVEIEILPNGEVRAKNEITHAERGGRKPLTMREDLGGEYASVPPETLRFHGTEASCDLHTHTREPNV